MLGFYTEVIGLRLLGKFENHSGYDGIFLGSDDGNWELEFTVSDEKPGHIADEDDTLVFYVDTRAQIDAVLKRAVRRGIVPVKAKNPYWNLNGLSLPDPDGFLVTLGIRSPQLKSDGLITTMARQYGINNWNALVEHVRSLPYGRNSDRSDFTLVLSEAKGSCSSKHTLLKLAADENHIDVRLFLGIYKMSAQNTKGIGNALDDSGLKYIPEAHCYLMIGKERFDFTNPHADITLIEPDILQEFEISPAQVVDFKVRTHQEFIRQWIKSENNNLSFDEIWAFRERCISRLSLY